MKHRIWSFLLVVLFISSCNGQGKTGVPGEPVGALFSFTGSHPKLIKTQGTDQYQNVHCSLQDKDGNLWFGTTGEGVYRFDGKMFTQFTVKDGLSDNKVWCILEDASGNIWFGTDKGLSRYDGKTISAIPISVSWNDYLQPGMSAKTTPSGYNAVWCMMQDKNGVIWIGTTEDLYCFKEGKFSRFLDDYTHINLQKLQLKWIQCILEDSHGTIWMGSGPIAMEGVIRFDGKSITSSKPNGDGWIRYIMEDKNGVIWFSGRQNGVFRYDAQTFKNFTEKENIGSAIFTDSAGNIWFDGGEKVSSVESIDGLWIYDGRAFKNFTTEEGMGKYSVWSMLEDKNGNIWIGTRNCGLYRYNGQTFSAFHE